MSKSGETSLSVKVLEEVGWVSVGRASGVFTGNAWYCIVGGWQVKEDVVAGIAVAQ